MFVLFMFFIFLHIAEVNSRVLPSVLQKLSKRSPNETGRFFGSFGGLDKVKSVLASTAPANDAVPSAPQLQNRQLLDPVPNNNGAVMLMSEPIGQLKPSQKDQLEQSSSQTQPLMGTYMIVQRQEIANIPQPALQHHLAQQPSESNSVVNSQLLPSPQQQLPVAKQAGFPSLDTATPSPILPSNDQSQAPTVQAIGKQPSQNGGRLSPDSATIGSSPSRPDSANPKTNIVTNNSDNSQQPADVATVAPAVNSAVKSAPEEVPKAQFVCHLLQESVAKH